MRYVSVGEAISAFKEGKTVSVYIDGFKFATYQRNALGIRCIDFDCILEGEWVIEDE